MVCLVLMGRMYLDFFCFVFCSSFVPLSPPPFFFLTFERCDNVEDFTGGEEGEVAGFDSYFDAQTCDIEVRSVAQVGSLTFFDFLYFLYFLNF